MTSNKTHIRSAILAGGQVFGTWAFHNNPVWIEIAASLGLDMILVDMEHGQIELAHIPGLLRAAAHGPTNLIVRTQCDDPKVLSRLLDMGVHGVVVPKVETAAQAQAIAQACRYPNAGTRGLAIPAVRASQYGLNPDYRAQADAQTVVGVQIESKLGIDAAAEIAAVEGVDLLFVGPNDLTADLGFAGHTDQSAAIVTQLIDTIMGMKMPLGTIPYHNITADDLRAKGVNMIIQGSDVAAQVTALKALVDG